MIGWLVWIFDELIVSFDVVNMCFFVEMVVCYFVGGGLVLMVIYIDFGIVV